MDAPFRFVIELPEHGLVVRVRHDGRALVGVELGGRRKARAASFARCKLERRFEADVRRYFAGERVAFRLGERFASGPSNGVQ